MRERDLDVLSRITRAGARWRFIETRIVHDPRQVGAALKGDEHAWKYRIGDYRLVCDIVDDTVTVYVIKVGHRREVYR